MPSSSRGAASSRAAELLSGWNIAVLVSVALFGDPLCRLSVEAETVVLIARLVEPSLQRIPLKYSSYKGRALQSAYVGYRTDKKTAPCLERRLGTKRGG